MDEIRVIPGEIFTDARGQIASMNAFRFDGVRRFYVITHPDTAVVRGWHGHRQERKWFYCLKGGFTLALVRVDNWEAPSPGLEPRIFRLSDRESQTIEVPGGYANCLKATEPDSRMLVFSGNLITEAPADSHRYDKSMWVDWSQY